MKFTIIGAGAVGGYFGAELQEAGEDVTFLVRDRRFDELQKNGLKVETPEGKIQLKALAVKSTKEIRDCDVAIVAVKNYNLEPVLESINQLASRGANVLTLMNGVEQFEKIRLIVPDSQIVGGVCHLESTFNRSDGLIFQTGITPSIILGSPSPEGKKSVMEAEDNFRKTRVKTIISENIIVDVWMKFVFITVLSTVTCMARSPIGPVIANPYSRKALEAIIEEIVQVAKRAQPELGANLSDLILDQIEKLPQSMTASMERDLEHGRPIEVENLQGFLVRKAHALGIPVPIMTTCYNILKLKENGAPLIPK